MRVGCCLVNQLHCTHTLTAGGEEVGLGQGGLMPEFPGAMGAAWPSPGCNIGRGAPETPKVAGERGAHVCKSRNVVPKGLFGPVVLCVAILHVLRCLNTHTPGYEVWVLSERCCLLLQKANRRNVPGGMESSDHRSEHGSCSRWLLLRQGCAGRSVSSEGKPAGRPFLHTPRGV